MSSFEALVPWFSSGLNRRMASDSLKSSKESLATRRFKPELNHGTKASKELIYI